MKTLLTIIIVLILTSTSFAAVCEPNMPTILMGDLETAIKVVRAARVNDTTMFKYLYNSENVVDAEDETIIIDEEIPTQYGTIVYVHYERTPQWQFFMSRRSLECKY